MVNGIGITVHWSGQFLAEVTGKAIRTFASVTRVRILVSSILTRTLEAFLAEV